MLICRYDKDANPNSCGGCQYGCIERKPATINKEFEKAVKDMEEYSAKKENVKLNYLDKQGNKIFVSCGLGLKEYGTFRKSNAGGLHRVKSPMMPMVESDEEAQMNLDKWAKKNNLKKAE